MKKRILAIIACALALSFILCACGGGDISGTWTAYKTEYNGEIYDFGQGTLTLEKDGTGVLEMMGTKKDITWKNGSGSGKYILKSDKSYDLVKEGSSLVFDFSGGGDTVIIYYKK